jgi:hypothetical protein
MIHATKSSREISRANAELSANVSETGSVSIIRANVRLAIDREDFIAFICTKNSKSYTIINIYGKYKEGYLNLEESVPILNGQGIICHNVLLDGLY